MNWDVRFIHFAQRFNIDPCAAEAQVEIPCAGVLSIVSGGLGEGQHRGKGLRGLLVYQQAVLAVCADGSLRAYDLREERWDEPQHLSVTKMKLVKGHLLLVGGERAMLLNRRLELEKTFVGHSDNVTTVAVLGRSLFTSSMDRTAREFSLGDASAERMVLLAGLPVAIPTASPVVKATRVLEGHSGAVSCVIATEKWIFTSSSDKTIRVWDRDTGELLRSLRGHCQWVLQLLFIDGILYSSSNDGTVRAWNVQSGHCLRMFACPSSYPHMIHVQDGLLLAAADCRIAAWHTNSSRILAVFEGHEMKIRSFIVEGKLLITASSDLTVRVWDVQTATCLAVLRGHFEPVNGLAVHGTTLFSSSDDGSVRKWNMAALEHKLRPVEAGELYQSEDELEDEDIDAFVEFMRNDALNRLEMVKCPAGDLTGAANHQRIEHKYWQRATARLGAKEPLFKEGALMQRTSPVCFERRWVTLHFPALYVYAAADDELPLRVFDVPQGATVKLSSSNPLIWAIAGASAQLEFVAASAETAKEWVEVLGRVAQLINDEARYSGASATVRFDMTAVMEDEPILGQFPAAPANTSAHVLPRLPTTAGKVIAESGRRLCNGPATTRKGDIGIHPAIEVTTDGGDILPADEANKQERRRGGVRLMANQRLSDLFPREFIEKEAATKGEEAVELQLRKDARRLSQLLLKSQLQSLVTGVAEAKKRDSQRFAETGGAEDEALASFEEHSLLPLPRSTQQRRRGSQSLVDIIASRRLSASPVVTTPECTDAHDPEAVKVMLLWIRYKRVRRFKRLLEQEHSQRAAKVAEEPRSKEEADSGKFTAKLPSVLSRARTQSVLGLKRSSGALARRRGRFQDAQAGGSHLAFRSLRQEDFDAERKRVEEEEREVGGKREERHSDGEEDSSATPRQIPRLTRRLKVGTWSPAPSLRSKVRASTLATMIQRSTNSAAATINSAEARMSDVLSRTKQVLVRGDESDDEEGEEGDVLPRVHMPYYHEDILSRPLPKTRPEEAEDSE